MHYPVTLGSILFQSNKHKLTKAKANNKGNINKHKAVINTAATKEHINPYIINCILPQKLINITYLVNRDNPLSRQGNTNFKFLF